MRDSNGGAAKADEGQHRGEGRCNTLPEHRRRATLRPDIAFAVDYVSCFMEDPRDDHWVTVKRLLRYVKGMVD